MAAVDTPNMGIAMKKILAALAIVGLVSVSSFAFARSTQGNDLAYFGIPGLDTLTTSAITTGDYIPVYDGSSGHVKKVDATLAGFSGATAKAGSFTTLATSSTSSLGDDVTLANGKALKTDTTTAHTMVFQAYDVDGTAYKTFGTFTNGNTPSYALAQPSGGTLTWDGGAIGSTTPAAGAFTTLTMSTEQTDGQLFMGPESVFAKSAGTWTITRIAQADYGLVHSTADDTGILAIDLTPAIRTAASKGQKLTTMNVVYKNITGAMDAHTATLDKVCYVNNVAVAVTSVPITGTLATATQTQPYDSVLTVTTPAYLNTADCRYTLEITANNSATSVYTFYGVGLNFSRNNL